MLLIQHNFLVEMNFFYFKKIYQMDLAVIIKISLLKLSKLMLLLTQQRIDFIKEEKIIQEKYIKFQKDL